MCLYKTHKIQPVAKNIIPLKRRSFFLEDYSDLNGRVSGLTSDIDAAAVCLALWEGVSCSLCRHLVVSHFHFFVIDLEKCVDLLWKIKVSFYAKLTFPDCMSNMCPVSSCSKHWKCTKNTETHFSESVFQRKCAKAEISRVWCHKTGHFSHRLVATPAASCRLCPLQPP